MSVLVYSSLNFAERNAVCFRIKIQAANKQRNLQSDILPFLKNNGNPRTLTTVNGDITFYEQLANSNSIFFFICLVSNKFSLKV